MAEIQSDSAIRIEQAANMLKAIAHPLRLAMLDLITQNQEMCVTDLYEQLGIEQAVASQHLKIMKDKQVLEVKRKGKHCFYSLKFPQFTDIIECIKSCQDCGQ